MAKKENDETTLVMRPIRNACKLLELPCERNATGIIKAGRRAIHMHSAGTWDLTVFIPRVGRVAMVECKLPGEELTPEQIAWGEIYRACGLATIVANSPNEFIREINEIRFKVRR